MRTIYQPTSFFPENVTIDTFEDQTFTCLVNGQRITDYQVRFYQISDNSLVYDTGKINLSPNYYFNGDTMEIFFPAFTLPINSKLKYTIEYWNNLESVMSPEIFFITNVTPILTLLLPSLVEEKRLLVEGVYDQAHGIPLKEWYLELLDSNDNIIAKTPVSSRGFISYTFDGLLSGSSYKVKGYLTTRDNISVQSPLYTFNVQYEHPLIEIAPFVHFVEEKVAVDLEFGDIVQLAGQGFGSFNYVDNFIYDGNKALYLDEGAYVEWNVDILENSTHHLIIQFPFGSNFEGEIFRFDNTENGDFFSVGYQDGRFYKNLNNEEILYSLPAEMSSNYFLIAVRNQWVRIYEWYVFQGNPHGFLAQKTHNQLSSKTHDQLKNFNDYPEDIFVINTYNI